MDCLNVCSQNTLLTERFITSTALEISLVSYWLKLCKTFRHFKFESKEKIALYLMPSFHTLCLNSMAVCLCFNNLIITKGILTYIITSKTQKGTCHLGFKYVFWAVLTWELNDSLLPIGAIQIIRDTLGGRPRDGVRKVSPNATKGREGVSQSVTRHLFPKFWTIFLYFGLLFLKGRFEFKN